MAFLKRTWLARIGTGLNKFIIGAKDGEGKQTLTNSPDSVTQQGDVISAENLNDLEDRIDNEFTSQSTRINAKQDTLTFDNVPTSGSNNPVKSGGIYTTIEGMKLTKVWENPNPTEWGTNSVDLGVVAKKLLIGYSFGNDSGRLQYKYVSSEESISAKNYSLEHNWIHLVGTPVTSAQAYFNSRRFGFYSTQTTTIVEFELANSFIMKSDGTATYDSNGSSTLLIPQVIYTVGDIYNS